LGRIYYIELPSKIKVNKIYLRTFKKEGESIPKKNFGLCVYSGIFIDNDPTDGLNYLSLIRAKEIVGPYIGNINDNVNNKVKKYLENNTPNNLYPHTKIDGKLYLAYNAFLNYMQFRPNL
jgi:hypothetical protein